MMERWPALFTEREVFAEYTRIACKNLQSEFFGELDRHTPRLMKIFRSKTGTLGQTLSKLLEQVESRRNTNQTLDQDSEENNFEQIPVGILLVDNEDSPHCSSLIPVRPVSTAIIIEGGEPSSVQKEDPLDSNPSMDSTPLPRSSEPVEVDREAPPCIPAAAARLQEVEVMGADRGLQAAEGQPEGHWITGGDERVGDQSEKDSNMEAEEMVRPLLSGRGHLRREKRRPVWTKDFELGLD
ncbi:uncharacterized protein [Paramormyrops kingsleyae]|uniref:uncharacterized protein n=1 Tax=Paramormyrops kingsleyae TaxID=1676925 RepID=UPI003B96C240